MYAGLEDLRLRLSDMYGDLYRRGEETLTDEALADLEAAAAEIDGMIGIRYGIPVTAAPALAMLKAWQVTLAEELAWSRSGKAETPKGVRDRVEHVRDCLRRVASGEMLLPGAEEADASGGGSVVAIEGDPPVFGRKHMGGY